LRTEHALGTISTASAAVAARIRAELGWCDRVRAGLGPGGGLQIAAAVAARQILCKACALKRMAALVALHQRRTV